MILLLIIIMILLLFLSQFRLCVQPRSLFSRGCLPPNPLGYRAGLDDSLHQFAHGGHLVSHDPHAAVAARAQARRPGAEGQRARRTGLANRVAAVEHHGFPQDVSFHVFHTGCAFEDAVHVRFCHGLLCLQEVEQSLLAASVLYTSLDDFIDLAEVEQEHRGGVRAEVPGLLLLLVTLS